MPYSDDLMGKRWRFWVCPSLLHAGFVCLLLWAYAHSRDLTEGLTFANFKQMYKIAKLKLRAEKQLE